MNPLFLTLVAIVSGAAINGQGAKEITIPSGSPYTFKLDAIKCDQKASASVMLDMQDNHPYLYPVIKENLDVSLFTSGKGSDGKTPIYAAVDTKDWFKDASGKYPVTPDSKMADFKAKLVTFEGMLKESPSVYILPGSDSPKEFSLTVETTCGQKDKQKLSYTVKVQGGASKSTDEAKNISSDSKSTEAKQTEEISEDGPEKCEV